MDSYSKRKLQRLLSSESINRRSSKPVPTKHRQEESNRDSQLDRNTMQETRKVKREVTITAGVLRPRYLRTYARPAPVNRAKEARLRLDRNHRLDEGAWRKLTDELGCGRRR